MKMLPRLHAQEQLSAIEAGGLGAGRYEAHDSHMMVEKLRQAANGDVAQRRPAAKADGAQLAAMGIGMRLVPARAQNDG